MTTPSMTATGTPAEALAAMLERFVRYFDLQQFHPAVELWDLPALVLGDGQVHGPMSRPQLERIFEEAVPLANLASLAGQLPRAGSRQGPSVRVEDAVWLAERVARLRARWPEQRFGGFLTGVEATEFLVRIDESGAPKIRALTLLPPSFPQSLVVGSSS